MIGGLNQTNHTNHLEEFLAFSNCFVKVSIEDVLYGNFVTLSVLASPNPSLSDSVPFQHHFLAKFAAFIAISPFLPLLKLFPLPGMPLLLFALLTVALLYVPTKCTLLTEVLTDSSSLGCGSSLPLYSRLSSYYTYHSEAEPQMPSYLSSFSLYSTGTSGEDKNSSCVPSHLQHLLKLLVHCRCQIIFEYIQACMCSGRMRGKEEESKEE